jgi:hypothetical protein
MSDFNYIEYLKNNPLLKKDSNKLITESQESSSSKMKKSDLKAKIREEILATLNEEDESLDEAKKDEEEVDAEVDAPAEDEMDTEMGAEVDAPEIGGSVEGLTDDEQKIQNSLKVAYDNAVAIGDQKLADQIGNSITFFTRTHVVER